MVYQLSTTYSSAIRINRDRETIDKYARSPLSIRIPIALCPRSFSAKATALKFSNPLLSDKMYEHIAFLKPLTGTHLRNTGREEQKKEKTKHACPLHRLAPKRWTSVIFRNKRIDKYLLTSYVSIRATKLSGNATANDINAVNSPSEACSTVAFIKGAILVLHSILLANSSSCSRVFWSRKNVHVTGVKRRCDKKT